MKTSRELITEYSLTPNKALGQNFLTDESAIGRIVAAAAEPGLPLLEIGPGLGALTFPLAETGLPLCAVELDSNLASILSNEMPGNARVVNADFLKCDLEEIHASLGGGELTAVGNLPYYITSDIVSRLATSRLPIRRMVLMMQKEAAERFTAGPGEKNYVPLTVISRLKFDITPLLELSPASYWPQPEVSSAVLVFESRGAQLPESLPKVVKAVFAMRRKTLANNLRALGLDKQAAAELIEKLGFPPSVRAEALTPAELLGLCRELSEPQK